MKKTLTIIILFFSSLTYAQTGEKNFIDQNFIEVTGTADMEIVPDQIFLKVLINEKDIKGKATFEEMEDLMINKLTEIGLDVKKDLAIIDLSSNFKYYFIKEKKIYVTKEYELKVSDANRAGKVIQELEKISISNISISKTDHSKMAEFKSDVKLSAIKAAKTKAGALATEIGQNIGKAIYIKEFDDIRVVNSLAGRVAGLQVSNITIRGYRSSEGEIYQAEIEFEKIQLQYSVLVRFELN